MNRCPPTPRLLSLAASLVVVLALHLPLAGQDRPPPDPDTIFAPLEDEGFRSFAAEYESWVEEVPLTATTCSSMRAPLGNEVHDCQRLVVFPGRAAEFGPLVAIYPLPSTIGTVTSYTQPELVAYVVNYGAEATYQGVRVAYAADDYPDLGIVPRGLDGPKVHCLWLRQNASGDFEAAMVPPPSGSDECDPGADPQDWSSLQVRQQTYRNASMTAYPNTARWQWSRPGTLNRNGRHLIGIKCGAGWCDIGPRDVTTPPIPQPSGRAAPWSPTRAIPGYSDAQFLAIMKEENWFPVPPPGGGLPAGPFRPGPWGEVRALPVPPSWTWAQPYEVVALTVDPAPPYGVDHYDRKLGLTLSQGVRVSRVVLQGPSPGYPNGIAAYRQRGSNAMRKARGVWAAGVPHGPAMGARWQWSDEEDETIWTGCWQGCCEVEEGMF